MNYHTVLINIESTAIGAIYTSFTLTFMTFMNLCLALIENNNNNKLIIIITITTRSSYSDPVFERQTARMGRHRSWYLRWLAHQCDVIGSRRCSWTSGFDEEHTKYIDITSTHIFYTRAIKRQVHWNVQALKVSEEIGRRVTEASKDQKETMYLFRRLSMAIQSNALSLLPEIINGHSEG